MTDITERLRENASLDEIEHGCPEVVALEREAADEIDQLRARNAELEARLEYQPDRPDGIACRDETIAIQDHEIDRLRNVVAELEAQRVPEWEVEAKRAFWSGLEIGASMGAVAIAPRWQEYIEKRKGEIAAAPAPSAPAEDQHSDDAAVDRFATAMKAKMAKKRGDGRGGWETASAQYLSELLRSHVEKGDPLDVANLAMMLHQNGQRITATGGRDEPALSAVFRLLEEGIEIHPGSPIHNRIRMALAATNAGHRSSPASTGESGMTTLPSAREIARNLYNNGMPCNCDLDKWEPEQTTGHSRVCRIHRTATNAARSAQENHTGQGEDA